MMKQMDMMDGQTIHLQSRCLPAICHRLSHLHSIHTIVNPSIFSAAIPSAIHASLIHLFSIHPCHLQSIHLQSICLVSNPSVSNPSIFNPSIFTPSVFNPSVPSPIHLSLIHLFSLHPSHLQLVFAGPVQSGFWCPNGATGNCNRSRPTPDIVGPKSDHLGLVYFSLWTEKRLVWTGFLS